VHQRSKTYRRHQSRFSAQRVSKRAARNIFCGRAWRLQTRYHQQTTLLAAPRQQHRANVGFARHHRCEDVNIARCSRRTSGKKLFLIAAPRASRRQRAYQSQRKQALRQRVMVMARRSIKKKKP